MKRLIIYGSLVVGSVLVFAWYARFRPGQNRKQTAVKQLEKCVKSKKLAFTETVKNACDSSELTLQAELSKVDSKQLLIVLRDRRRRPTLRNDIANELMNRGETELPFVLMAMLEDGGGDPVWRNYCAQLLEVCYEIAPDTAIWKSLRGAAEDSEFDVASCAIWGLAQIVVACPNTVPGIENEWLCQRVLRICGEPGNVLMQSTGFRCAEVLRLRDALPALRHAAAFPGDIFLRTTAIHALGQFGDLQSKMLLAEIANGGSLRLSKAANAALKKIDFAVEN